MKQILAFALFPFAFSLSAQGTLDVIESDSDVISYEDSLFVIKKTTITSTNLDGINDTTITYVGPLDTADVINTLHTDYVNEINSRVARWRRALTFRDVIREYNEEKAYYATLGYDLDSLNVMRFGNAFKGRYRVIEDDGNVFFVDVIDHPNNNGLLRAVGTDSEGNFNLLIYGGHFFRININGTQHYLSWDGESSIRPVFRWVTYGLPTSLVTHSTFRMVKLN